MYFRKWEFKYAHATSEQTKLEIYKLSKLQEKNIHLMAQGGGVANGLRDVILLGEMTRLFSVKLSRKI